MAQEIDKRYLKLVGQKVNKVRKEKNFSFGKLALASYMEKSNLVKFATTGSNITLGTLNKIAKALEVDPKDLLP